MAEKGAGLCAQWSTGLHLEIIKPVKPMTLTREKLEALFNCNAPNARQIATLGLHYPLRKGWMNQLIGQEISDALYAELMDCKGRRPRGIPKKQWRKPCTPTD